MKFPMKFNSMTSTAPGMNGTWETTSGDFSSTVAIPPEFSGPGGGLSPEDLFNHALTNCFVATFKVYAANSKLSFKKVTANSNLVVDLGDSKKPVMKSLKLKAQIHGASDGDKAQFLAKKAAQSGFILNSVKTDCQIEIEILES